MCTIRVILLWYKSQMKPSVPGCFSLGEIFNYKLNFTDSHKTIQSVNFMPVESLCF